jgi:uncharacterized protein (DUF736 family)
LFVNARKQSDTHPDLTGTFVNGDGVEFFVDAWKKKSASGKEYISGRLGRQKNAQVSGQSAARANGYQKQDELQDDVPW